jgi:hypothetical protein
VSGGSRHGSRDGFVPPLPHDPPPPPGYVDPLAEAEALADLTALVRGGADEAPDEQAAS